MEFKMMKHLLLPCLAGSRHRYYLPRSVTKNRRQTVKYELKRVGIFSVVKISFVMGGAAGFLGGLFAGLVFAMIGSMFSSMGMPQELGDFNGLARGMGVAMIFILPLVYGFIGAVFGAIYGFISGGIYNVAARLIGGLEWETIPVEGMPPVSQPIYTPPPPPPPPPDSSKPMPPSMFE